MSVRSEAPALIEAPEPQELPSRRVRLLGGRLRGSHSALAGGLLVGGFVLAALVGLALAHVPGLEHLWRDQDLSAALEPPGSSGHLLGTDALGRDVLARLLVAISISFELGLAVTAITLVLGLVLGLVAGFFGGWADTLVTGVMDVAWGFPLILLAVMLAGIVGPGFLSILLAVGLLNWAGFARIVRGYAISLREQEFVQAARAIGIPGWRILLRHLVPNVVAPVIVMGSYYVAVTIIVEAGVSFLGLGIQPPTPSLGQMIADGRNYLGADMWQAFVPGAAIALAVLGFNLLGDGLRDLLDPRLARVQG